MFESLGSNAIGKRHVVSGRGEASKSRQLSIVVAEAFEGLRDGGEAVSGTGAEKCSYAIPLQAEATAVTEHSQCSCDVTGKKTSC